LVFLFEIYITGDQSPSTNIKLPPTWTNYPTEKEVLLLPYFCFMVTGNRQVILNNKKCVIVTLVEMPKQNLLEIRPIILSRLIWIDPYMYSDENRFYS
jgi:hypothetical protein